MALERWFFDGWELTNSVAWGWSMREGTDESSALIGANTPATARAGELYRPKVQGPGRFTMNIWLRGATREAVDANHRTIVRAMRRRGRTITVARYRANGEQIMCDAEVVGPMTPQHVGQTGILLAVTFNIPDGVWRSMVTHLHSTGPGESGALTRTLSLTGLEPSTEYNDELLLRIYGPGNGFTVHDWTDGASAGWFAYNAPIASGRYLLVNCRTWNLGGQLVGGATDNSWVDLSNVRYSGDRFLSVAHGRPGLPPRVRFTVASGASTDTRLEVEAPRIYTF